MPIMNASNDHDPISFSEIQVDDQPDTSQCRFLNSNASPGRTDMPTTERKRRLNDRLIARQEENGTPTHFNHFNIKKMSMSPVSQEGTVPTSTGKSDLDEHLDEH